MSEQHEISLEARPYGPNSNASEKEAIRARVTLFSPDTLLLREIPVMSVFATDLIFDKAEQLTQSLTASFLLVDLTETQRPQAAERAHLRKRLAKMEGLKYVALYTGKNFLLNIAVQFVFGTTSVRSFSVHKTQEDALLAIQKAKDALKHAN